MEARSRRALKSGTFFMTSFKQTTGIHKIFLTTRPSVAAGIFSHQELRVQMKLSTNVGT